MRPINKPGLRIEGSGVRTGLTCFKLPAVLSRAEALARIAWAEAQGFERTGVSYPAWYRNNDRLVRDDAALAAELFARLAPWLPARLERDSQRWALAGLNERFRYCRYRGGQHFSIHRDGAHARGPGEQSLLTCQVYLNDAAELSGGATRFYADRLGTTELGAVEPEAGTAIVFDHELWHDGAPVTSGTKYVMRTDVLYRREPRTLEIAGAVAGPTGAAASGADPGTSGWRVTQLEEAHRGYIWAILSRADGRLATAARDQEIRLWRRDRTRWFPETTLRGHRASVTALAELNGVLWSGSRDGELRVWHADQSRCVGQVGGAVLALAAIDGVVVSASADGTLRSWRPRAGVAACQREGGPWIWAVCPLGGSRIAAVDEAGWLRIEDLSSGAKSPRASAEGWSPAAPLGSPGRALCLAGPAELFVGTADGAISRWSLEATQPRCLERAVIHEGPITALASRPDGTLLSASEDGSARVLEARPLRELARLPHPSFVRAVYPGPEGTVLTAGYDGALRSWAP